MPSINILEKLSNGLWNGKYSKDVGAALIHLGATGWFFSALAQIVMLARNKDIDKKEKKFLIPQEIADGVINVGLYYTICQSIKSYFDQKTELGTQLTKKVNDFVRTINPTTQTQESVIKGFAEAFRDYEIIEIKNQKQYITNFFEGLKKFVQDPACIPEVLKNDKILKQALQILSTKGSTEQQLDLIKNTQRNFNAYKNGVGVLAAVGASILACNIITPIARNITANHFQRKLLKEQNRFQKPSENQKVLPVPQKPSIPERIYTLPKSNTFNSFNI